MHNFPTFLPLLNKYLATTVKNYLVNPSSALHTLMTASTQWNDFLKRLMIRIQNLLFSSDLKIQIGHGLF
jgi:hypothetical protein